MSSGEKGRFINVSYYLRTGGAAQTALGADSTGDVHHRAKCLHAGRRAARAASVPAAALRQRSVHQPQQSPRYSKAIGSHAMASRMRKLLDYLP